MEKIVITRRELIRQIPADLSEHDRTVSLLNALSERLPKNAEKEDVHLQSGDFDEAFRLLNAFDPRTYGTVQLGESLREEQMDTAKEHVGVLGLSDTALPGNGSRISCSPSRVAHSAKKVTVSAGVSVWADNARAFTPWKAAARAAPTVPDGYVDNPAL